MFALKHFIETRVDQDRLYLAMVAITVITVIKFFLVGSYPNINEVYSAGATMEYISTNLQTSPITDIKVIAAGESCPKGYMLSTIGEFYGSEVSCWDRISKKYTDTSSSCFWIEYFLLRKTIPAVHGSYFHNWFGSNFCILRNSDFYYTLAECQPGFEKCGATLCVPESENCPISDVKLIKADNGTFYMTVKNDHRSNNHVYKLDYSLNGLPCVSQYQWPASNLSNKALPLIQSPQGCNPVDTDALTLANATGEAFFSQYSEFLGGMADVPLVREFLFQQNVVLVARKHLFIIWNNSHYDECLELVILDDSDSDESFSELIRKEQDSETYFNYITYGMILLQCLVLVYCTRIGGVREFIGPLAIFIGITLVELIAIGVHSWVISDIIPELKESSVSFVKAGYISCFQNTDLNNYLNGDFANVWATYAARVPAMKGFFWIMLIVLIAFSGVSAVWVLQNKDRESFYQFDELIRDSGIWNRDHLREMQEVRARQTNPKNEDW